MYRSNRLDLLAIVLAEEIRVACRDPLRPVDVVVGSRGMERHLRHTLAEKLGVCAHVNFPFPNAALDALASDPRAGPDPWAPECLTWALLEVLPKVSATASGGPVRSYLDASRHVSGVDARTWGFAARVAEIFDGYITHRPELVAAWGEGRVAGIHPTQQWQPALWQAVRAHLGSPPHRAERLASLDAQQPDPAPLFVFGLSTLAAHWLTALGVVARHRPVGLYLLVPSNHYWADLGRRLTDDPSLSKTPRDAVADSLRASPRADRLGDEGHPLLVSWGRTGRDGQILLESLPDGFEDRRVDLFIDPTAGDRPPSALHVLQADILNAVHPAVAEGFSARVLDPNDRSIQFHDCHGPMRQVEVLRTVLLELLDAHPSLLPRDIVVMTPDIDAMAPLIGAVFGEGQAQPGRRGWAPVGSPRLPWDLADLAVRRLNPVADALMRVLELVDGRAAASEVLELLALEPVADRFAISSDDLVTVRSWIVDSGICWAADAAHRVAHAQPDDAQNTWQFGLQRLLLGVVMADDGRLPAGIRPCDTVEGGATRLVGRLAEFCATLFEQIDRLRSPRPLRSWADQLGASLDALTQTAGNSAWLTRRVREEIAALGEEATASHSALDVHVDALRAAIARRFEVASSAHQGSGGAITFCGMVPERAVPYRVVCLLGMDGGSFPRSGDHAAFDLLQQSPRIGDRNVRDEDRYLLLEAVLSARTHLLVFYTGRDLRTNELRPPAVAVSELGDALAATWPEGGGQGFTRQHPLQTFARHDFEVSRGAFSYDARLLEGVRAAAGPRAPTAPFLSMDLRLGRGAATAREWSLDDLIGFWRHPVRAFMGSALRIHLARDDSADVPDREPMDLGWLDRNKLLETLLTARAQGTQPERVREALRASGQLPLGGVGRVVFEATLGVADALRTRAASLNGWQPDALTDVDLDLSCASVRLVGRLSGLSARGLVAFRYGSERPSDLLEAWLQLLAWRAHDSGAPRRAIVLFGSLDAAGAPQVTPIGLEACNGPDLLADFVTLRQEGLTRPLPFFPKTSFAVSKSLASAAQPLGDEEHSDALKAARASWTGDGQTGEAHDRYNQHAFGSSLPYLDAQGALRPEFLSLAHRIWGPVLGARRTPRQLTGWREP